MRYTVQLLARVGVLVGSIYFVYNFMIMFIGWLVVGAYYASKII